MREPHFLEWAPESDEERSLRRERLCRIDGLLFHVEQWSERHGSLSPAPIPLLSWYRRLGGDLPIRGMNAYLLIEACFQLQERYVRVPVNVWRASSAPFPLGIAM